MLVELFNILAPVIICIAIGSIWHRAGLAFSSDFVMQVVMNVGAPCLIVSAFNNQRVSVSAFSEVALVAVILMSLNGLLAWLVARRLNGDTLSMVAPVAFPNWGNMGLALSLFAFGQEGLALALAFFLIGMVAQMLIGVPLFMQEPFFGLAQFKNLIKQPVIYAICLSLLLLVFDFRLPVWLASTTSLLGGITIPLMLVSLGVSLAAFSKPRWGLSIGFALLRMIGGLLIALMAIWALGIEGLPKKVILLQSIMPAAIFNYLLAAYYGRDKDMAAGIVITSTLLSFILIPLLLSILIQV